MLRFLVRSAALGRVWSGNGRAEGGRRLATGSGVVRPPKGGAVHRIPRFPPLADQVLFSTRASYTPSTPHVLTHVSALLLTKDVGRLLALVFVLCRCDRGGGPNMLGAVEVFSMVRLHDSMMGLPCWKPSTRRE